MLGRCWINVGTCFCSLFVTFSKPLKTLILDDLMVLFEVFDNVPSLVGCLILARRGNSFLFVLGSKMAPLLDPKTVPKMFRAQTTLTTVPHF